MLKLICIKKISSHTVNFKVQSFVSFYPECQSDVHLEHLTIKTTGVMLGNKGLVYTVKPKMIHTPGKFELKLLSFYPQRRGFFFPTMMPLVHRLIFWEMPVSSRKNLLAEYKSL